MEPAMPEKRRRTKLNYKTLSRCALTNKVIRYANVETQTSPAVVVGKLYVALERVGAQGQSSSSGDDSRAPGQEPTDLSPDGRVPVALNDAEERASLRVSLPLTLLTSQEKSPARAEVNNSEDEGGDSSDAGTSQSLLGSVASLSSEDVPVDDLELQRARSADLNITTISLSSNVSVTSGEEHQSDAEFELEDKRGVLSILFPDADEENTPRDDWVAISSSNRNAENSRPIEEEEEEEKEEEEDDGDSREDDGRKRQRKRLNKYLRIKANIVHIHNHFYRN